MKLNVIVQARLGSQRLPGKVLQEGAEKTLLKSFLQRVVRQDIFSLPANSMTRVLFLNRSYYPDAEATGQLLTELCEDLATDFEVTVIAGQPNQNPQNVDFRRAGKDVHNDVTIRRVWNTRLPKTSLVGRSVNLLSYLAMATLTALTAKRQHVVVVETDPPLLCLVGALLKKRFGCKLVIYLQDIHPDLGVALGKLRDGLTTRWLRRLFFAAYRRADRVVVLSDDMRNVLIESDLDPARIEMIPNWVDTDKVTPVKTNNAFRRQLGVDNKFVVMYSGNLGLCQGLDNVLLAAQLIKDRDNIEFVFVGDGVSKQHLLDTAIQHKLTNVRFVDYQPASRLSESLSAADLHLVPIDPRVSRFLMPSKLYGVLASGTPLIAVAPETSDLAQMVESERVGLAVEPNDPHALAEKILWFAEWCDDLQAYGERARDLAVQQFDRRISVHRFQEMLLRVTGLDRQPVETFEAETETANATPPLKGQTT